MLQARFVYQKNSLILKKNIEMNIQAEKIEIMKMILNTDNPAILESVKKIFATSAAPDFWDARPQDQKDDILQGIKEIEDGDIVDYEDFIKQYR